VTASSTTENNATISVFRDVASLPVDFKLVERNAELHQASLASRRDSVTLPEFAKPPSSRVTRSALPREPTERPTNVATPKVFASKIFPPPIYLLKL